jgi:hypothetical protein
LSVARYKKDFSKEVAELGLMLNMLPKSLTHVEWYKHEYLAWIPEPAKK